MPHEQWWQGPHLNGQRNAQKKVLTRWVPGRIDSVDQAGADLFVAEPPARPAAEPTYGTLRIARRDLETPSAPHRVAPV